MKNKNKKSNMKKRIITIFIFIFVSLLFGFINTYLIQKGVWEHFFKGVFSIPWYIHLLLVFIGLFLAIMFHELGHFFTLVYYDIPVKAIYVLAFGLVRTERGFRIKFIPRFLLMLGGIVIPDKMKIRNIEDETKIVQIFKKVLLNGPKASYIYCVVIVLLWIVFLQFKFYELNGILFTLMVITSIITYLAIKSSKLEFQGVYGDFVAARKIEEDMLFRLSYLIQSVTLIEHDKESIDYFWPQLIDALSHPKNYYKKQYLSLLSSYIEEVAFEGRIGSTAINSRFNQIENQLKNDEDGMIMAYYFLYFYESMNDTDSKNRMLNRIQNTNYKVQEKIKTYYEKLTNHLLGISDETDFFSNPQNNYSNSLYFVYKPLEIKEKIKPIFKI